MSKLSVANVKAGQGNLPDDGSSGKKTALDQGLVATELVYCHPQHTDSSGIAKWCGWNFEVDRSSPKREGEIEIWGLACSPFVTGETHMRGEGL